MQLKKLALPILLTLTLGGCAAVGPNYERPEVRTPEQWSGDGPGTAEAVQTETTRWWSTFKDPVLDSLVDNAVRSNLDLRTAQARVREARALRSAAASGYYPNLDASATYQRSRTSLSGSLFGGGGGGFSIDPERDLFQAGFDARWELDVFGGVRREVEAAEAGIQAAQEGHRDVLLILLSEVARNYVDLRGFQQQLDITRKNIQTQQETLELTEVRFNSGLISELEVSQSRAQLASTQAQVPRLESAIQQTIHRLSVLSGQTPETLKPSLTQESPIPTVAPLIPIGLPSDLLRRRPDIRRSERELAAATARIGIAVADQFPRFSLTGSFGRSAENLGDLSLGASQFWGIGPAVSLPIFNAGRIRANIEVQNARQEQALSQYEQTILTSLEDVENALVAYASEQTRVQSLKEAVASNRRAVELADELYSKGLTDFLNVLESQRSLYASEDQLSQSERTIVLNVVALYKALGGGWEAYLPEAIAANTETNNNPQ